MEEDEDIKKISKKEKSYEDLSIHEIVNKINELKNKLKSLENLLQSKKIGQNEAGKLFKK